MREDCPKCGEPMSHRAWWTSLSDAPTPHESYAESGDACINREEKVTYIHRSVYGI